MAAYAELKRGTKAKAIRLPSALVVDDTVTLTRTDVVAQRVARVEASQTTIVRTLQRRSTGDSSQQLTKLGRPIIKEWEPDFRLQYEYESFRFAATNERWRKTIWTKWTNRRHSLFYAVSTVARHRLMEIWRTEEPHEHGFVEDSWVHDQTQDGDVHKNPSPSDQPMSMCNERRKGVNQPQSGQPSTRRWQHKRRQPWPNPTPRQARATPSHTRKLGKRRQEK